MPLRVQKMNHKKWKKGRVRLFIYSIERIFCFGQAIWTRASLSNFLIQGPLVMSQFWGMVMKEFYLVRFCFVIFTLTFSWFLYLKLILTFSLHWAVFNLFITSPTWEDWKLFNTFLYDVYLSTERVSSNGFIKISKAGSIFCYRTNFENGFSYDLYVVGNINDQVL